MTSLIGRGAYQGVPHRWTPAGPTALRKQLGFFGEEEPREDVESTLTQVQAVLGEEGRQSAQHWLIGATQFDKAIEFRSGRRMAGTTQIQIQSVQTGIQDRGYLVDGLGRLDLSDQEIGLDRAFIVVRVGVPSFSQGS